jgi:hypothetical protein
MGDDDRSKRREKCGWREGRKKKTENPKYHQQTTRFFLF